MKKTIALLLALVLCLSLCACGGGNDAPETNNGNEASNSPTQSQEVTTEATEPELDILGEWISIKNQESKLVFNEDGTCVTVSNDVVKYSVDYDIGVISVYDSVTRNYNITQEDNIVKLTINGSDYVRAENFADARAEYVEQAIAEVAEVLEGKTPLEFNVPYQLSDKIEITILSGEFTTHTTRETDVFGLWFTISLHNLTDSEFEWQATPYVEEGSCSIRTASSSEETYAGFMWEYHLNEEGKRTRYPANEEVKLIVPLWEGSADTINESISAYGKILGYATFVIGDVEYYIDFSQFPVNE